MRIGRLKFRQMSRLNRLVDVRRLSLCESYGGRDRHRPSNRIPVAAKFTDYRPSAVEIERQGIIVPRRSKVMEYAASSSGDMVDATSERNLTRPWSASAWESDADRFQNVTSLGGVVALDDGDDGMSLAEAVTFSVLTSICICATIVGNILVIMSVFTYRPLRGVQNFFIVSLAVADLAVAILVLPFNVADFVIGRWVFGAIFCNMWLTFDILTCTASILNLCAIAIDRYYAIHDPIRYAQKRTLKRVLVSIALVWIVSAVISIPPLIGWNNSGGNSLYNEHSQICQLTSEWGFVIYSASGSFYIPLLIMTFVYYNIFRATRRRLRARAKAAAAAKLQHSKNTVAAGGGAGAGDAGAAGTGGNKERLPSKGTEPSSSAESPDECQDLPPPEQLVPNNNTVPNSPRYKPPTRKIRLNLKAVNSNDLDESAKLTCPDETCDNGTAAARVGPKGKREGSQPRSQVSQFLEERQRISLSKERRAARTMAIIMGAFVVCWLPFFLMYVIFPFCERCARTTDKRVVNFITWLGYVNSTLNPVIYTIFNIDFRRAFKNLLLGKCKT
ncbi:hypothetical protein LSH36_822g00012 [Paralvinella palmiformis]|uniref:G-protein coupled receptors family 1 profile domain-containing protein n=1 Tax=Paralvinella palmiformis TaxID=53620 RepID=A0AAD9J098_9ANNE|nr:hypothetical protein LSH36_822g00012 [Paralvinella palmiformis]